MNNLLEYRSVQHRLTLKVYSDGEVARTLLYVKLTLIEALNTAALACSVVHCILLAW